ncbi:MAG: hypothetical protein H7Y36_08850 [Armatimonadetes bacterium]|nr:hypothetical protein [Akkermansiaceae bacterium]
MQLFHSECPLIWGELDLPLLGISSDWFGNKISPPVGFSLAADPVNLWFVTTRQSHASLHPDSISGEFRERLWDYDVAELFIADPQTGEYIEFNLAANVAWWAAKFSSPRMASVQQPHFEKAIESFHDSDPESWLAAICVPLDFLVRHISFGHQSTANVTFILHSPRQTFQSAHKLSPPTPDFHLPNEFPKLIHSKLPAN